MRIMEGLLKHNDALRFLEKIGMKDSEDQIQHDPISFLHNFIQAYAEHVPFQCVSIIAQTKEEKHVPTLEEIVEASLSLEGGVCFTLNTFVCILLKVLGFKAEVVSGCYSARGETNNHVIVLVNNLRYANDNYLIDVGCGFPWEGPLAVKDLPCTRISAGLEYKHEWLDDTTIIRLHRMGDDVPDGENVVSHGEWRQIFHFNLKPVNFDFFIPYMEGIYTDELNCDFHSILRAIRFLGSEKVGRDGRIMVAFKDRSLLEGPMDNATKTKVTSEEWAQSIKDNFPTIPPHKVDLAVRNLMEKWRLKEQQTEPTGEEKEASL